MRTIKYRAKVKLPEDKLILRKHEVPEGQWVYGEPHTIDCPTPHIHTVDVGKQPIDEETICQFTGLKDRNGKEIYEGDIIRRIARISFYGNNKASVHVVKFGEDGIYNGFYLEPQCDAFFVSHNSFIFEVIGNIHDNPELMK